MALRKKPDAKGKAAQSGLTPEEHAKVGLHVSQGQELLRRGKLDEAIRCFTIALQIDPATIMALSARCRCFVLRGHLDKALKDADALIAAESTQSEANLSADPQSKPLYRGLLQKGDVLFAQGEFEKAARVYHEGHRLRPDVVALEHGIHKCDEALVSAVVPRSFVSSAASLTRPRTYGSRQLTVDDGFKRAMPELAGDVAFMKELAEDPRLFSNERNLNNVPYESVCKNNHNHPANRYIRPKRRRGDGAGRRGAGAGEGAHRAIGATADWTTEELDRLIGGPRGSKQQQRHDDEDPKRTQPAGEAKRTTLDNASPQHLSQSRKRQVSPQASPEDEDAEEDELISRSKNQSMKRLVDDAMHFFDVRRHFWEHSDSLIKFPQPPPQPRKKNRPSSSASTLPVSCTPSRPPDRPASQLRAHRSSGLPLHPRAPSAGLDELRLNTKTPAAAEHDLLNLVREFTGQEHLSVVRGPSSSSTSRRQRGSSDGGGNSIVLSREKVLERQMRGIEVDIERIAPAEDQQKRDSERRLRQQQRRIEIMMEEEAAAKSPHGSKRESLLQRTLADPLAADSGPVTLSWGEYPGEGGANSDDDEATHRRRRQDALNVAVKQKLTGQLPYESALTQRATVQEVADGRMFAHKGANRAARLTKTRHRDRPWRCNSRLFPDHGDGTEKRSGGLCAEELLAADNAAEGAGYAGVSRFTVLEDDVESNATSTGTVSALRPSTAAQALSTSGMKGQKESQAGGAAPQQSSSSRVDAGKARRYATIRMHEKQIRTDIALLLSTMEQGDVPLAISYVSRLLRNLAMMSQISESDLNAHVGLEANLRFMLGRMYCSLGEDAHACAELSASILKAREAKDKELYNKAINALAERYHHGSDSVLTPVLTDVHIDLDAIGAEEQEDRQEGVDRSQSPASSPQAYADALELLLNATQKDPSEFQSGTPRRSNIDKRRGDNGEESEDGTGGFKLAFDLDPDESSPSISGDDEYN